MYSSVSLTNAVVDNGAGTHATVGNPWWHTQQPVAHQHRPTQYAHTQIRLKPAGNTTEDPMQRGVMEGKQQTASLSCTAFCTAFHLPVPRQPPYYRCACYPQRHSPVSSCTEHLHASVLCLAASTPGEEHDLGQYVGPSLPVCLSVYPAFAQGHLARL